MDGNDQPPPQHPYLTAFTPRIVEVQQVHDTYAEVTHHDFAQGWRARMGTSDPLAPGDQAVMIEADQEPVLIARISSQRPTLQLATGHQASVAEDGQSLELRSPEGKLLLSYQATGTGGMLTIAADTLQVTAQQGDLNLAAAGNLVLQGQAVAIRTGNSRLPALEATAQEVAIHTPLLTTKSERSQAVTGEATVSAQRMRAKCNDLRIESQRLESVTEQFVQRARNLYQWVDEVSQQQVGTLRFLVQDTMMLQAKRILKRAEREYRVRADSIHLG